MPTAIARAPIASRLRTQKRAAAAGSIISPTASNVPERLEAAHEIEHHQRQKNQVHRLSRAG